MSGGLDQRGAAWCGRGAGRRRVWLVAAALAGAGLGVLAYLIPERWTPGAAAVQPADWYGAGVLAPALLAIVLALVLRQVVPALAIGTLLAAAMLVPFTAAEAGRGGGVVASVRLAVEHYLVGAIAEHDHIKVIVFSLLIGAMVGVIAASGGTAAVVSAVARWGTTRRRGQVATWAAGLLVFFDDYANAMIIGPAMRPVCDRLGISRAKLAYIVDSTAAPVASLALIGTWIGYEIGCIQAGLDQLVLRPAFLDGVGGYQAFLTSLPYRFYPILALVMVLLVAVLGRDFGPMRRAEAGAAATLEPALAGGRGAGRAVYALVPVGALIAVTLALLVLPGWRAVDWGAYRPPPGSSYAVGVLREIVTRADPFNPILYGAIASLLVAVGLALVGGALSLRQALDAGLEAMGRLLPTMVVLVLAWTLSAAMKDLQLGEVAVGLLRQAGFGHPLALRALPACVFLSAGVVSFATGTSWGTMGILCPAAVTIAAGLVTGLPAADAAGVFYASVGAVLAGAVFGDHCSPISDTTVLSSLASACPLEEHVWTQMPYALTVAGVAVLSGDVLVRYTPVPAWGGLALGSAALLVIVRLAGQRPTDTQGRQRATA